MKGLPSTALMNGLWSSQPHRDAPAPASPHTTPLMVMSRVGPLITVPTGGSLATELWRFRRPQQHSSFRLYSTKPPGYDGFDAMFAEEEERNPIGSEEVGEALPPYTPEGGKMTAFEYFNHPYFFDNEEDRKAFVKWYEEATRSTVEESSHGTESSKAKPSPNEIGKKDASHEGP